MNAWYSDFTVAELLIDVKPIPPSRRDSHPETLLHQRFRLASILPFPSDSLGIRTLRPTQGLDYITWYFPGLIFVDTEFSGALYNVAPSQQLPIVIFEDAPKLVAADWGLLPAWADPSKVKPQINARAESIADKPMFRSAFKARRCVIPVEGYYEWQENEGGKIPHYFRLKSREPFRFAGLWETGKNGRRNYAVITTAVSERLSPYHHRMPVILPPESFMSWIDSTLPFDKDRLLAMLASSLSEDIEVHEVSKRVNSPRNDGPDLLNPA